MSDHPQPPLHALLPVHAARERRRLLQYQNDRAVHQRAHAAEQRAAHELVQLQAYQRTAHAAAFVGAAQAECLSAELALAALHYANALGARAARAQTNLQQRSTTTAKAAHTLADAQQAYAKQTRTHRLLKDASDQQRRNLELQQTQRLERHAEEEFLLNWTAPAHCSEAGR